MYSRHCFGTADAISFDEETRTLRVHDLKTGVNKASYKQLLIYAALFCLEYGFPPGELKFILRIYQNNTIIEVQPEPEEVMFAVDKIVRFTQILEEV